MKRNVYKILSIIIVMGSITNYSMQKVLKKISPLFYPNQPINTLDIRQAQTIMEFDLALKRADIATVEKILQQGHITIPYLYIKLEHEIQARETFTLQKILQNPELADITRKLFIYAEEKENIPMMAILLDSSNINIHDLFNKAVQENKFKIIKLLLATGKIYSDKIMSLFQKSIETENLGLLQELLDSYSISKYRPALEFAINKAVKYLITDFKKPGNPLLLLLLLHSDGISDDTIDLEFDNAVDANNLAVIKMILKTNKVLNYYIEKAVTKARETNNELLLQILTEHKKLSL
jgi:hypothetical protein